MYRVFARKMVQIQSANFTACSHSTCIFEKYDFLIFHILVTFLKTFLAFFSNWSYRLLINKA